MNATDHLRKAYDDIPYDSFPYSASHPDRMGVVGALNGIRSASPTHCRVLELGCASAGNLIPMADALPNSRFVGVDLSPRQIEQGTALVRTLGLTNIELRAHSIMDFPADDGPFDYIIAHGMYSWVPDDVREKLMEICATQLAPTGLCFISCKTFPGWHINNVLRDLMLFHARNTGGGIEQAAAARQILEFATGAFDNTAPQAQVARQMAVNLLKTREMFLSHDHLSPVSHPVLFEKFAAHAQSYGLRYVGHADPAADHLWRMPPAWQQAVAGWSASTVDREQYVDFLCWRSIRFNILCRADAPVDTTPQHEVIQSMHVAGRPVETVLHEANSMVKFSVGEVFIMVNDTAVLHVFRAIKSAWPGSIPFPAIIESIPAPLRGDPSTLPNRVIDHVLAGYRSRLLELWTRPVDFLSRSNSHPRASKLARWQAERSAVVTTLRHEMYSVDETARTLLTLLDGSREIPTLYNLMAPRASSAQIDRMLQTLADESLLDIRNP